MTTIFHNVSKNNPNINGNLQYTDNGDVAHATTLNNLYDLFARAGNINVENVNLGNKYLVLLNEDEHIALRFLQYLRDCRGGAGRRTLFHQFLDITINTLGMTNEVHRIIEKLPELGYWKDILLIKNSQVREFAIRKYLTPAIFKNKLAAKYAPRLTKKQAKNYQSAKIIAHELGLIKSIDIPVHKIDKSIIARYNRLLSNSSNTIEQYITRKDWVNIKFPYIPSKAMVRHKNTFKKYCLDLYNKYLNDVSTGKAKINAKALNFAEITAIAKPNNTKEVNALFNELLKGIKLNANIMPVCDVSGSMAAAYISSIDNTTVSCLDAAVGLSVALAKANQGKFKDLVMTFSSEPTMMNLSNYNTPYQAIEGVKRSQPYYSTNIDKVIYLLLNVAKTNNVPQEDMPKYIVLFSDMQFDNNYSISFSGKTFLERAKQEFLTAGYEIPKIIFWNLSKNSRSSLPATVNDDGVIIMSGFDAKLITLLLSEEVNPIKLILDILMSPRYDL